MKIELPFVGGAYTARSKNLSAQECQNFYVEIDKEGGKNIVSLIGTPGMKLWKNVANGGELRAGGLHVMGEYLYSVIDKTIYRISKTKVVTNLGDINTSTGQVWMGNNGTYVVIVDGEDGWYISGTTLTQITDASFPTPAGMDYQDGFWLVLKKDTDEIYYNTSADDPTAWDATDFFVAEGSGDKMRGLISSNRIIRMYGFESTEIWYKSASGFDRNPGGFMEIGCGSVGSISEIEGVNLWLDNKGRVCQTAALSYAPVSTYQIDYQLSKLTNKENSVSYCYSQEGHNFYVLTFPDDNKTFCYDIKTGFWHTRASTIRDLRHNGNCHALFNEKNIVGGNGDGNLYEYDLDTYADNGIPFRSIRSAQAAQKDKGNIFVNYFELDFESGVGLSSGQGSDPKAMLEYSWNGGQTWSNEIWEGIGKIGAYADKVRFDQLGSGYNGFVPRITISDPVKRVIINAYLDGEVGYH